MGILIPNEHTDTKKSARQLLKEDMSTLLWKKVGEYQMPSMPLARPHEVKKAGELAIAQQLISMQKTFAFIRETATV